MTGTKSKNSVSFE